MVQRGWFRGYGSEVESYIFFDLQEVFVFFALSAKRLSSVMKGENAGPVLFTNTNSNSESEKAQQYHSACHRACDVALVSSMSACIVWHGMYYEAMLTSISRPNCPPNPNPDCLNLTT